MFGWPPPFFRSTPKSEAKPRASTPRAPKPRAPVDRLDVAHQGAVYPVRLRRNPAARRLILRIHTASGEPVLTLPARVSLAMAKSFLDRHGGWIAQRMARVPAQIAFEAGALIPFRGQPTLIAASGLPRGRVVHAPAQEGAPARLTFPGDPAHLPRRVADFLKSEAKRELTDAASRYAATLGVTVARITIKDTKSRWGSCSARGALAFSWRLILAPPFVLEYLAAHEVAHRREMNHSDRYWAVVDGCFPQWREAESWLTKQGASLHRYGPAGGRPAGA